MTVSFEEVKTKIRETFIELKKSWKDICVGTDCSNLVINQVVCTTGEAKSLDIKFSISFDRYVLYSQGINKSTNFCFLQRLSVIFGFCGDFAISCFLLRLLGLVNSFLQSVHVILLPAESLSRKQNHTDRLCRKPFFVCGSVSRKQEITNSLGRKRKLADSFIPCDIYLSNYLDTVNHHSAIR